LTPLRSKVATIAAAATQAGTAAAASQAVDRDRVQRDGGRRGARRRSAATAQPSRAGRAERAEIRAVAGKRIGLITNQSASMPRASAISI